jgi:hypothetical protein
MLARKKKPLHRHAPAVNGRAGHSLNQELKRAVGDGSLDVPKLAETKAAEEGSRRKDAKDVMSG